MNQTKLLVKFEGGDSEPFLLTWELLYHHIHRQSWKVCSRVQHNCSPVICCTVVSIGKVQRCLQEYYTFAYLWSVVLSYLLARLKGVFKKVNRNCSPVICCTVVSIGKVERCLQEYNTIAHLWSVALSYLSAKLKGVFKNTSQFLNCDLL